MREQQAIYTAVLADDDQYETKLKKTSPFGEVVRRLMRDKMAVLGLIILVAIIVASICAPIITSYGYSKQAPKERFIQPGAQHLLGTDNFGRDILSRVLYGGRYTMFIAFVCTTAAALIGSLLGMIAAYFPKADNLIMRGIDIFMGIPMMLMCVSIVAALGSNMTNMMIALTVTLAPTFARVMRAQVLTVKNQEFIEAARSIGASNARIMLYHILPNSLAPIIVQYTLGAVTIVLQSASLSFVGMGVQPPTPEWGLMISAGRAYLRDYWWIPIMPGLAIVLTAYALNMLGDGLRDALDPRLKQ